LCIEEEKFPGYPQSNLFLFIFSPKNFSPSHLMDLMDMASASLANARRLLMPPNT